MIVPVLFGPSRLLDLGGVSHRSVGQQKSHGGRGKALVCLHHVKIVHIGFQDSNFFFSITRTRHQSESRRSHEETYWLLLLFFLHHQIELQLEIKLCKLLGNLVSLPPLRVEEKCATTRSGMWVKTTPEMRA